MNNDYAVFLHSIKVNEDEEGRVDYDDLREEGLTDNAIQWCLQKFVTDGIANGPVETFYTSIKPKPTYPKSPRYISQPNGGYTKAVFTFKAHGAKLGGLLSLNPLTNKQETSLPTNNQRFRSVLKKGEVNFNDDKATENSADKRIAQIVEHRFPFRLPAGTRWEQIILNFLDDERVLIKTGRYKYQTNYQDMGFADTRGVQPKPSVLWRFLKVLAQKGGEVTIRDPEARDVYKKQKELITNRLQQYFSIDYDPFHPYAEVHAYRIKLTLIPPLSSNTPIAAPNVDEIENELTRDIRESYEAQTPSVNDG